MPYTCDLYQSKLSLFNKAVPIHRLWSILVVNSIRIHSKLSHLPIKRLPPRFISVTYSPSLYFFFYYFYLTSIILFGGHFEGDTCHFGHIYFRSIFLNHNLASHSTEAQINTNIVFFTSAQIFSHTPFNILLALCLPTDFHTMISQYGVPCYKITS